MPEERLDLVINARDYATETLRGVTGAVRSLGMSTVMLASNFAMLTRELGIQSAFLNGIIKTIEILGVMFRTVGATMNIYTTLTKIATAAEWAHSAALAFKIALIPVVGAALVMGAMAMAAAVKGMATAPSMQYGGVVLREGVYYLHAGEAVVPRSAVTSTSYGPTVINVYFENRAPISSELDAYGFLRDLGSVIAEKVRRGGHH